MSTGDAADLGWGGVLSLAQRGEASGGKAGGHRPRLPETRSRLSSVQVLCPLGGSAGV